MLAVSQSFPKVSVTNNSKIGMGRTLTELGYERKRTKAGQRYQMKHL